ncbi:ABC transporter ATP-binding protein [Microbulbifer spongiae]|uniref:ABC transporter ATP-binding protein/permease n=1 Tax=Microbulbifer spongiae TaxID=2944933 RepID=A0ABY9EFU3_9GAMM|nr:ABC transporter ATP-binding protein [Microbulbifer sp. MI-G]WKD51552.1 ABC transporter ATP-binding protein/permease [Microbulbifer sp. MI-G]
MAEHILPNSNLRKPNLRELMRPFRSLVWLGVVLGACGALTSLIPFIGIVELARLFLTPDISDIADAIIPVVFAIVAGLAMGWICTVIGLWLTHIADQRMQAELRRALVRKLGQVPLGWYSEHTSGAVRKAVQDDLDDLHHMVAHHQVELAAAFVLPLAGLGYLSWLDWRLALLAVLTLPVYLVSYAWMMRGFGEKMQQLDKDFARVSAAIVEFVHGIAVVKVFSQTGRAHKNYQQAVEDFSRRYTGWVTPLVRLEAVTSLALSVPVIMLVSLSGGAWLVVNTGIQPIDVLATTLIAVMIPQTILTLSQGLTAQQKAKAAAGRIDQLLGVAPLAVTSEPKEPKGAGLLFKQVSFAYTQDRPVLSDINLRCRPGSITALVGSSGAGKSTLAKLVPRFYDVTQGAVLLGGVDVRDIAPDNLYRHVGFVLQETQLLAGTVADNLRLGRPDASDQDLEDAARSACIHEHILSFPQGYQAVIGKDAFFSGGEAQRLSIARTLLADAPVLILDEATAHADPESEAQIQQALSCLVRNRTVLVIAHKLHTITGVDQIAVLDGGRLVECGSHRQLLAEGKHYAELWRLYNSAEKNEKAMSGEAQVTSGVSS